MAYTGNYECTGIALDTVKAHSLDQDITLFGSSYCPFSQRAWVAFEALGIPYKYHEVDPYHGKPQELLDVSPKGLVPGLKLDTFITPKGLNESTVILEHLNDVAVSTSGRSLMPPVQNPYARSLVRLQCDHVNRSLVPAFFRYLFAQDPEEQLKQGREFTESLETLATFLERAEKDVVLEQEDSVGEKGKKLLRAGLGLWIEGNEDLGFTDVMVAPWLYRATNVLKHYRGYTLPAGEKLNAYIQRVIAHPAFAKTCSTEELYLDFYEKYAYNRLSSQLSTAINSGKGIP